MTRSTAKLPITLCVDLDGVLQLADLSTEALLSAVKRQPWIVFLLPVWLLRGVAHLKHRIAERAHIDPTGLPYCEVNLEYIRNMRAQGRAVWLVTSCNVATAQRIAAHLPVFDRILASEMHCDLPHRRKTYRLDELLGAGAYEFLQSDALATLGRFTLSSERASDLPLNTARSWLKAIRVHQWAKNALVFVPLITAHRLFDASVLVSALAAFVALSLCASATYILNDLFDLDSDRHHRSKRHRPFAAGVLSARAGLLVSGLLLAGGVLLALPLPWAFQIALGVYLLTTLMYSFRLKRVSSLDVLLLAGLYTLRVVAGAWATGLELSFWLLAFSMFIFLCLAMVKRVAELIEMRERQTASGMAAGQIRGREYSVEDIPILQIMGATSGYLAVLVFALYIQSPDVAKLYATPEILWLIAPLMLLWVTRLWVVTTRGYMDDDPIFFAIKDPETWITAAITAAILLAATQLRL